MCVSESVRTHHLNCLSVTKGPTKGPKKGLTVVNSGTNFSSMWDLTIGKSGTNNSKEWD